MRSSAIPLRESLVEALVIYDELTIDFEAVEVTQGFVDELLGQLVLRYGAEVMQKIRLKSCSDQTKQIIQFVVGDRANQIHLVDRMKA